MIPATLPASTRRVIEMILAVIIVIWIHLLTLHDYLLFHSLVEVFSVVVAWSIFILAVNAWRFLQTGYFLFLGIGFLFVGTFDLLHTLAYQGMGVFPHRDNANLATQLWIAGRYFQSGAFLLAPFFLRSKPRVLPIFVALSAIATALLLAILKWPVFPVCFVSHVGLTPFKKVSEYIVCLVLAVAFWRLYRNRNAFHADVFHWLALSILLTTASELSFTLYADPYGLLNLIGHILKVVAFVAAYKAIIEKGMVRPYDLIFRDLKLREGELRASEEEFRAMFESSGVGMAQAEPASGQFTRVNRKFCALTGYPEADLLRMTYADITHPDDRDRDRAAVDASRTGTVPGWTSRKRYIRKDGTTIWVDVTGTVLRDANGRANRSMAVIQDITERLLALEREKEALTLAAAAQSAIDTVEAMGEGVLLMDMEGRITSANPAVANLVGHDPRMLMGQHIQDVLPAIVTKEALPGTLTALAKTGRGEAVHIGPTTLVSEDGRRTPVLPVFSLVRGPRGRPASIVLTMQDISELTAMHDELVRSEAKYRELVENANSIILRLAPDQTITFFNEYAQAFFGYTRDEAIGQPVVGTILAPVDTEGNDMRHFVADVLAHPERYGSQENENVCRDGRRVWVHWANRAIRDELGNVRELLCVGSDITRRKQMEAEARRYRERLRSLADRLVRLEEEERQKMSGQIHDTVIQTLSLSNIRLGGIREAVTAAGLARESDGIDGVRKLIAGGIGECRSLMADLTPPLLFELGLGSALKDLATRLTRLHGVRIAIEEHGTPPPMDRPLRGVLFQSTRELVVNALKHAEANAISVTVTYTESALRIEVTDEGKGFDTAELHYSRASNDGGFGLFNIRERLEGIGGRFEIHSRPGKGTRAVITVSRHAGSAPAQPARPDARTE